MNQTGNGRSYSKETLQRGHYWGIIFPFPAGRIRAKREKKEPKMTRKTKGKIAGDKIKPGRENRDGKGRGEGGRRREKEVGGSGGSGGILTVLRKVKKESVIFDGETMESEMRGGRDERGLEDVVEGRGRKRE